MDRFTTLMCKFVTNYSPDATLLCQVGCEVEHTNKEQARESEYLARVKSVDFCILDPTIRARGKLILSRLLANSPDASGQPPGDESEWRLQEVIYSFSGS